MSSGDFTVKPLKPEDAEFFDDAFGVKNALLEFNPGKCILPPHHLEFCQKILDAPVREDDVWLLSYPRTGSTWCQEMIWLLMNNLDFDTAQNIIQQLRAPLIETSSVLFQYQEALGTAAEDSVDFVNNKPSPRLIKSHLPLALLPTQLDKVKPKIIYTYRDPKDLCVSYYYHFNLLHHLNCSFEKFCELFLRGVVPLGSVFDHYLPFWNKRHETNFLFLRYEDMKKDMKGSIKKIAKFLDKSYSEDEYDSICDFLSFENMQKNKGCNLQGILDDTNGKGFFDKLQNKFIRKGIVGDWKNHMSLEMAKRFDDWIEENTKGTGLSFV